MNISEATATLRVCQFLAGAIDHEDESTRLAVARDIAFVQARAIDGLHAGGTPAPASKWDERLCLISFDGDDISDIDPVFLDNRHGE